MANVKIHEQLAIFRKQKGLTQEEFARIFGVTNQSVSKWESGACCPDISLLPDIASFFGVSIDTLFGQSEANGLSETIEDMKRLFLETAEVDCFDLAYKLAFYLHEGVVSNGYKGYLPWDINKERKTDDDYYKWGSSVVSEPGGVTVMQGNSVLISSQKRHRETVSNELMEIQAELQKYADEERLITFFALYELTRDKFDVFVRIKDIINKTNLSEDKIREAFKWLPIHHKRLDDGSFGYRIEGSNMHIPAITVVVSQTLVYLQLADNKLDEMCLWFGQ